MGYQGLQKLQLLLSKQYATTPSVKNFIQASNLHDKLNFIQLNDKICYFLNLDFFNPKKIKSKNFISSQCTLYYLKQDKNTTFNNCETALRRNNKKKQY